MARAWAEGNLRPLFGSCDALVGVSSHLPLSSCGVSFDPLYLKFMLRLIFRLSASIFRLSELVPQPEARLHLQLPNDYQHLQHKQSDNEK